MAKLPSIDTLQIQLGLSYWFSKCKYTAAKRRKLNYHKKVCKKYLDLKLSPLEKEVLFSFDPSQAKKTKFTGIGRNLRHANGRPMRCTSALSEM